jgi:hypothetical protein
LAKALRRVKDSATLSIHVRRALCETLVASPLLRQRFDEKPKDLYSPQDNASDARSIVFEVPTQL